MKLITGGAYQGKTDTAKWLYKITESDIEICTAEREPDFTKKCVTHLERYALYCVRNGLEPKTELEKRFDAIKNSILISDDVSCGVVPMDKTERAWREACGRMLSALSQKADSVVRVFCGIAQILKEEDQ